MPRLHVERLDPPSSIHAARVRAWAGDQATDELAGRRVWCAAGSARGRDAAAALAQRLRAGARAEPLMVGEAESVRELAPRLDALLWGRPVPQGPTPVLDAADRAGCAEATAAAEVVIGPGVGVDDLVVVHDVMAALAAQALRERGVHVAWHLQRDGRGRAGTAAAAGVALEQLRPYTGTIDAYISSDVRRTPGRGSVLRVAAVMPTADLLAATEVVSPDAGGELAWRAALAEVVTDDRAEHVGGRLHVRPAVAAR